MIINDVGRLLQMIVTDGGSLYFDEWKSSINLYYTKNYKYTKGYFYKW